MRRCAPCYDKVGTLFFCDGGHNADGFDLLLCVSTCWSLHDPSPSPPVPSHPSPAPPAAFPSVAKTLVRVSPRDQGIITPSNRRDEYFGDGEIWGDWLHCIAPHCVAAASIEPPETFIYSNERGFTKSCQWRAPCPVLSFSTMHNHTRQSGVGGSGTPCLQRQTRGLGTSPPADGTCGRGCSFRLVFDFLGRLLSVCFMSFYRGKLFV